MVDKVVSCRARLVEDVDAFNVFLFWRTVTATVGVIVKVALVVVRLTAIDADLPPESDRGARVVHAVIAVGRVGTCAAESEIKLKTTAMNRAVLRDRPCKRTFSLAIWVRNPVAGPSGVI